MGPSHAHPAPGSSPFNPLSFLQLQPSSLRKPNADSLGPQNKVRCPLPGTADCSDPRPFGFCLLLPPPAVPLHSPPPSTPAPSAPAQSFPRLSFGSFKPLPLQFPLAECFLLAAWWICPASLPVRRMPFLAPRTHQVRLELHQHPQSLPPVTTWITLDCSSCLLGSRDHAVPSLGSLSQSRALHTVRIQQMLMRRKEGAEEEEGSLARGLLAASHPDLCLSSLPSSQG